MSRNHDRRGELDEHDKASDRLDAARAHQERLVGREDAAQGTPGEMGAWAERRDADEQVAAREAWVEWLHRDY